MVDSHKGDKAETPHSPPETQALKKPDADQARHAGASDVSAVEAKRTNASDGSLRDRLKKSADQAHSIEITSDTGVSSRTNRLTEKDLQPHTHTDTQINPQTSLQTDHRSATEKLGDFVNAAFKRAADPHGRQVYIQGELDKIVGIGEGLNMAKDETKESAKVAWKALTDGTVAKFLATPDALNHPLSHAVGSALDAMAKDPQAVNKSLTHLGEAIVNASASYTALPNREKGHVIGKTMFGMVNPEGSTEAGEAVLKVADNVATHVDAAVMAGVKNSYTAAQEIAKNAPAAAGQAKQMLLNHATKLGLSPQQAELAGIPRGYFDGMQPFADVPKSDHMLAMSAKEVPIDRFGKAALPGDAARAPLEVTEADREAAARWALKNAEAIRLSAEGNEKVMTPLLQQLAEQTGGSMAGLEERLKEVDSLTRKILQGNKPEDIKDALRYTMTFPCETFTERMKTVKSELETMGFPNAKVKNTFKPDGVYKGLNCCFELSTGQKFELQFHTPESLHVKQAMNHKIYDVSRELVRVDETGKDVLKPRDGLLEAAKKYNGSIPQYPHLNELGMDLARAEHNVEERAQNFLNQLNNQMRKNYEGYPDPAGVETVLDFVKKGE